MIHTRFLAHPLSRMLALFAGLLLISTNVFAYEEDTHFSMTYVICRSVGFTADEALIVAAVDQGMDDSSGTVANGGIGGVIPNVDEEWKWHALDGYGYFNGGSMHASGILARRDLFFQAALKEKDPRTRLILLGVFFHYQQDTWGHRHHYETTAGGTRVTGTYDPNHLSPTNYTTYNTPTGHAPDGHAPDRPPFDPVAAVYDLENGIVYARTFLQQALGRQPGGFLAGYTPQGGQDDSGWNDSRKGTFFHEISLSGAPANSARAYVLNLIRAQINVYGTSISPNPRYVPYYTPDEANLDQIRTALNQVCANFEPYRSAGIPNPAIAIPTTAQKVAAGFTNMTTPWVESLFSNATSSGKQIISAANADGRLEVFYVGMDNNLYHNWQTAASASGWNGQAALGGAGSQIASARNKNGALEVFFVGTDSKIYHNWQDAGKPNGWNGPVALGGSAKQIAAAANKDGRLEIFYIGTNNNIYHNWQDSSKPNGWSGEASLGGSGQQITAAANSNGSLEIFYVGTNSNIYHNWQDSGKPNGWNGEAALGGSAKQIAAAANKDGRLEIFYIGTNNQIYHNWQASGKPNGWNGEASLGGSGQQITAAANSNGSLEIFYVGTNNQIYHNWQDSGKPNGWNGETALGGSAKQISAILNTDNWLQIFYIGIDNVLYTNHQSPTGPGGWNGQEPL